LRHVANAVSSKTERIMQDFKRQWIFTSDCQSENGSSRSIHKMCDAQER
jgi:hypothetical protein